MRMFDLAWRSCVHYRRQYTGVVLSMAVATAVLVGALGVGDSMRQSLEGLALERLGDCEAAVATGSRPAPGSLAYRLSAKLASPVAAVWLDAASVSQPDRDLSIGQVQIMGIDSNFPALTPRHRLPLQPGPGEALVNRQLANRLNLSPGEHVVVRLAPPRAVAYETPLAQRPTPVALRLRVSAIIDEGMPARFGLRVSAHPRPSLLLSRSWMAQRLQHQDVANLFLVRVADAGREADEIKTALRSVLELGDTSLRLERVERTGELELTTDEVFLSETINNAALSAAPGGKGILTYLVNSIRTQDGKATPYSFVSAIGEQTGNTGTHHIRVTPWLAEDLKVAAGQSLSLEYYVQTTAGELIETSSTFTVRSVIEDQGAYAPDLMPRIPGLADADTCKEWKPGAAIDLSRIRDKDEDYWEQHRGAPKAYIDLPTARELWNNRFGNLTAVRWPLGASRDEVARQLLDNLEPAALGFEFLPLREDALNAARGSVDFGGLFLSLSFFVIVAAIILTGLLFAFHLDQLSAEAGTLAALGFSSRRILRHQAGTALLLALAGAIPGALLGVLYTHALVYALNTLWQGASAETPLVASIRSTSVMTGLSVGMIAALSTMVIAARRRQKSVVSALQRSTPGLTAPREASPGRSALAALILMLLAGGLIGASTLPAASRETQTFAFFGAGAILLAGQLQALRALLLKVVHSSQAALTLNRLALLQAARRRSRSLAVVSLLSVGVFLVVAISAFRQPPLREPRRRASGTGGFVFYAETSAPLPADPRTVEGRRKLGLDSVSGLEVVPMRILEGDDAGCRNLYQAQTPRVLGVDTTLLQARGSFSFAGLIDGTDPDHPWQVLRDGAASDGSVPAIGDLSMITWGLHKKLGDIVEVTSSDGQPVKLRLVGGLQNSILQGSLVIDERHFVEHFPDAGGRSVLLVDTPEPPDRTRPAIRVALADYGLELTPSAKRLAAFSVVENTYLSIFMALGGLGVALGAVGIAVVTRRNLLERRGELSAMRATGWTRRRLTQLVLREHLGLLAYGLFAGTVSGLPAVAPALLSLHRGLPVAGISLLLLLIAAAGSFSLLLNAWSEMRAPTLRSLRTE